MTSPRSNGHNVEQTGADQDLVGRVEAIQQTSIREGTQARATRLPSESGAEEEGAKESPECAAAVGLQLKQLSGFKAEAR